MDIISKALGICHSDLKVASGGYQNFYMRNLNQETQIKTHMPSDKGVVLLWWKSLLCSRPKSLTLLFGLCSSSLLKKSFTLCCTICDVVRTFFENLSFWMLSTDTEIKFISIKNAIQMGDSVFLLF